MSGTKYLEKGVVVLCGYIASDMVKAGTAMRGQSQESRSRSRGRDEVGVGGNLKRGERHMSRVCPYKTKGPGKCRDASNIRANLIRSTHHTPFPIRLDLHLRILHSLFSILHSIVWSVLTSAPDNIHTHFQLHILLIK